jgi:hypothetical protein
LEGNRVAGLFVRHDLASQTRYEEIRQLAQTQRRVLQGTPGTLKRRSRRGTEYWVREHIRVDGAKDDEHLGTVSALDENRLRDIRAEVGLAKGLAAGSSRLRLLGYQRIERKPSAVLAALFNRGLFESGLTLVGSHAYGALLNDCGIIAAGYRTHDIDVARAQPLALALGPELDFRGLLQESGLDFVEVPGMPSHRPSVSFKLRGAEVLGVDLLVPGEVAGKIVAVAELGAHAQAVPFLDYLVEDALDSVVLSPNQVVPVKIPTPQRFALHKLYSSQRRGSSRDKGRKDLQQASVLIGALEEETPGLLSDALRHLPARARDAVKRGAGVALKLVDDSHPEANGFLERIAAR